MERSKGSQLPKCGCYRENIYLFILFIYLFIWGGGSLGSIVGGLGDCTRVILVLCKCIWKAPAVSLVLPGFEDTGSLGSPPRQVVYPSSSMVPLWVTASRFHEGNRKVELKSITFSSFLLFRVFLSFLFS